MFVNILVIQAEIPRAFVCAEGKIFDVSEWAICQVSILCHYEKGGNMTFAASTCIYESPLCRAWLVDPIPIDRVSM